MSFSAIVVNSLNIFFWNYDLNNLSANSTQIYALIVGEHLMIAMKYLLAYVIPDMPEWVSEAERERRHNKEAADRHLKKEEEKHDETEQKELFHKTSKLVRQTSNKSNQEAGTDA
jgi:hypothetical protein